MLFQQSRHYYSSFLSDSTHSTLWLNEIECEEMLILSDFCSFLLISAHFCPFSPIFGNFWEIVELFWGNLCPYNTAHYYSPFLNDSTPLMWFNVIKCWFWAISGHFCSFRPVFMHFWHFWEILGPVETISAFRTFQALLLTISERFHPFDVALYDEILILSDFWSFPFILSHFHPFSAFFEKFWGFLRIFMLLQHSRHYYSPFLSDFTH